MNKSQIIQTILGVAKNAVGSQITLDDEQIKTAKKIIRQGESAFEYLNEEEVEYVISLLGYYYSYEEIEECIDFLQM